MFFDIFFFFLKGKVYLFEEIFNYRGSKMLVFYNVRFYFYMISIREWIGIDF